jgi:hypothetical protein
VKIVLSCPQYRPGSRDVATDQALWATTTALTPRSIRDCSGGHQRAESRKRRALPVPVAGEVLKPALHLTVFQRLRAFVNALSQKPSNLRYRQAIVGQINIEGQAVPQVVQGF